MLRGMRIISQSRQGALWKWWRGITTFFPHCHGKKEPQIGKYKVLITHGHYYYVNTGLKILSAKQKEEDGYRYVWAYSSSDHRLS